MPPQLVGILFLLAVLGLVGLLLGSGDHAEAAVDYHREVGL